MAQYWYEFGDVTAAKKPAGFLYRDTYPTWLGVSQATVLGNNYVELDSSKGGNSVSNIPVFMLDRDLEEFELLTMSLQRTYQSGNSLYNGGRGIGVRCVENINLDELPISGLLLCIGSSFNATYQRATRQYVLPNVDSNVGTATPLAVTPDTIDKALRPVMTRIKVTNSLIQTRHWYADTPEPTVWHLTYAHSFIGRKVYLGAPSGAERSVLIGYSFLSIATEGDEPLIAPLTRVRLGEISPYYAGRKIRLRSPSSGCIYDESIVSMDGSWALTEIICETVPYFNVFVEVNDGEVLVPDGLNGDGYLGGDHPDGLVKENSAPVVGTIRVVLRDNFGSSRDGFVVAETTTNQDGSWRVEGLNRAYRYDVICRLSGYNDQIYSNVAPKSM